MTKTIEWYAWEMFTASETNAWWLMMCVFAITCITFIITNISIRKGIRDIKEHFGIKKGDKHDKKGNQS